MRCWHRWAWLALAASTGFAAAQTSGVPVPSPSLSVAAAWEGEEGRLRVLDALMALFARAYFDPDAQDWAAWGDAVREPVRAATSRRAFDTTMERLVRSLGDGHSVWLGRPSEDDGVAGGANDTGPKLGVQLAYVEGRGLIVERVYPDTPADRAGLRRADVITGVGGLDLRQVGSLFDANRALTSALLAGPVDLRVERGSVAWSLEVVGAAVAFADLATRPYATMLDVGLGYLHVPTFNAADVAADVHEAIRRLQAEGAHALVLDLRGNLGGRVLEAGLTWGAFAEGTWAVAMARGDEAWRATAERVATAGAAAALVARLTVPDGTLLGEQRLEDPTRFTGPVVVVVGAENASAAELVTAALVEAVAARVVGERTSGNVEAVRAFDLPDGSRVLVAIADMRTASGRALDGGIVPDVVARADVRDLARGSDPPVAEARRVLGGLPFTPGRFF